METGHCICGVVVFNWSLYSRVYGNRKLAMFVIPGIMIGKGTVYLSDVDL